jgi:hypothetical protein
LELDLSSNDPEIQRRHYGQAEVEKSKLELADFLKIEKTTKYLSETEPRLNQLQKNMVRTYKMPDIPSSTLTGSLGE